MDLKRSVALVDSKPMVIKADPSMAYVGKLSFGVENCSAMVYFFAQRSGLIRLCLKSMLFRLVASPSLNRFC